MRSFRPSNERYSCIFPTRSLHQLHFLSAESTRSFQVAEYKKPSRGSSAHQDVWNESKANSVFQQAMQTSKLTLLPPATTRALRVDLLIKRIVNLNCSLPGLRLALLPRLWPVLLS